MAWTGAEEGRGDEDKLLPHSAEEASQWVNLCWREVRVYDCEGRVVHIFQRDERDGVVRVRETEFVRSQFVRSEVHAIPVLSFARRPGVMWASSPERWAELRGKRVIVDGFVAEHMTAEDMEHFEAVYVPCIYPDLEAGGVYDGFMRHIGTRSLVKVWPAARPAERPRRRRTAWFAALTLALTLTLGGVLHLLSLLLT